MSAREVIARLALQPHPEGGWYREFYRSSTRVRGPAGDRSALTSIHFLLEQHQISRWHIVESDEVWHFYAGAPLELFSYEPDTSSLRRHVLSAPEISDSASVAVIPRRVWQAARTLGDYSHVGCSVGPGFDFCDFSFVSALPDHARHFKVQLKELASLL